MVLLKNQQGVLVAQVSKHSPAEAADLRQGDIIERFQGEPVKEVGKFRNQVALTAPGRAVELTILRDGKYKTLRVTIGKLSKDKLIAETSQRAEDIGLTVQTLTPQLAEQFGAIASEGVIVTEVRPGSIAAMAGIKPGTIILQVNRKEVKRTRPNSNVRSRRAVAINAYCCLYARVIHSASLR